MSQNEYIDFFNIKVSKVTYSTLLNLIESSILNSNVICITYANVNALNTLYNKKELKKLYSKFDIIHPDGIGIYLASRLLYSGNCFKERFAGNDFFPLLIDKAIKNNWSFFFFGDVIDNLKKIELNYPELNVVGYHNGYSYDESLIEKINDVSSDILIVGLGSPKQEIWIQNNRPLLNTKIILAVGDGIKVFAGVKRRGLIIFRKLGLEWFVRVMQEPRRLWKRYVLGIPLFIIRIMKLKILMYNHKIG